jgi:hypothetical protein
VLLLLSLVCGKTTFVDQNSVWKVEQVKNVPGEGVISKCLNGRLTDATNKLRASIVDVIRESRGRGAAKEHVHRAVLEAVQACAKRRKQQTSKGLAAPAGKVCVR